MFVERFVSWAGSASVEERASAIGDVASTYLDAKTSDHDRTACVRIFTLFLDDPSSRVRASLARTVATLPNIPAALTWNLINDIPEVAAVLFEHSTSMCPRTLMDTIENGAGAVQAAVARREDLSGDMVRALVSYGKPEAAVSLLENSNVVIGPNLKHEIAARLGQDADVRARLLDDVGLDPTTRQMLVHQLSKALFSLVDHNNWLETPRMERVANDSKNKVTLDISMESDLETMVRYVEHLRETNQLTTALMIRSICSGNAMFFEVAVSQLSGRSIKRVQSIVDAARHSAFKALYKQTGLSSADYPVFFAAVKVWQQFGASNLEAQVGESVLCDKAINEILARVENDSGVSAATISMLRRLSAETSRESARDTGQQLLLTAA